MPGARGSEEGASSASCARAKTSGEVLGGRKGGHSVDRWACVSLAAFPLQIMARDKPEWRDTPSVVVSEDKPQGKVLWANAKARHSGVVSGQSYALALSLSAGLRACVVSQDATEAAMRELQALLWQFSPAVEASDEAGGFWLDASGLESMFASLTTWSRGLRERVAGLGFQACVVVGFSRFGTYALARAGQRSLVLRSASEEQRYVACMPLASLDIEPTFRDVLDKLGVHTVEQLLSLPESGLLLRFGPTVARLRALASGSFAPLSAQTPTAPIIECTSFDTAESDSTRLLFGVKRLLTSALARLVRRKQALLGLQLRFKLDRCQDPHEPPPLRPAVPTLDERQVIDLVRLQIESMTWRAGVIEVAIEVTGTPAQPEQLRVFAEHPRRDSAAGLRAIARLRAELGADSVVRAVLRNGHLPEASYAWEPIEALFPSVVSSTQVNSKSQLGLDLPPLIRRIFQRPHVVSAPERSADAKGWSIYNQAYGPVTHVAGPFALNGGWWLQEVQRDYQYVLTRSGALFWVYLDKRRQRWMVHAQVQ